MYVTACQEVLSDRPILLVFSLLSVGDPINQLLNGVFGRHICHKKFPDDVGKYTCKLRLGSEPFRKSADHCPSGNGHPKSFNGRSLFSGSEALRDDNDSASLGDPQRSPAGPPNRSSLWDQLIHTTALSTSTDAASSPQMRTSLSIGSPM